ncbi:MAG: hypothetical protein KJ944_11705 [Alphaproteobacteria bacterium]|nr:hypothetical protein [Alphaproteobacteria bacterium]MBU1560088.1 hypothetical protein [Alphaproteobacteria bacterium]MBU2303250.1 hypothetical protein [Alphaproteobacteria bacterium]MBU2366137.1 hypothetical protein [Alphaproteobacteria bacterium]
MRRPVHRHRHVQRRRIFVGCEGESERGYIAFVSNTLATVHLGVHLDAKVLRPGGGDPLALVQVASAIIDREQRNREPYERKFVILDADKLGMTPARDQQARDLAARIGAALIWQDKAHEALLLRHLVGCGNLRPATTALAEQQLKQRWPEYEKPMSAMALARRLDIEALRRASLAEPDLLAFLNEIGMFPPTP